MTTHTSDHLLSALAQLLGPQDGGPRPEDLADVLWISHISRLSGSGVQPAVPVHSTMPCDHRPVEQLPVETPTPASGEVPEMSPDSARHFQARVQLHPLTAAATPAGHAHVVQVSRPRFLPDPLHLNRALRPLRQMVPAAGPLTLDEEATAQTTGQAGCLLPVWRQSTKPRFGVDLLVDTGSTMAVWHHLASELYTLLERHGAFNDVRCWSLNTDTAAPSLRPYRRQRINFRQNKAAAGQWYQALRSADSNRILLVLTDGVGPAWRAGQLTSFLARAVNERPTAALQVLPRRLWHRTALPTTSVETRVRDPLRPVQTFRTAPAAASGARRKPANSPAWLPVMEVHGSWLTPWAEQLAGRRPDWVPMLATPLNNKESDPEGAPAPAEAAEQILRFQSGSTPEAYRLACHLAAVPLSLPVMRIVQQAVLPRSKQTDLAQLFVSGLISRRNPEHGSQDPDDIVYDFQPGVRDELLAELTRGESLHLLEDVLAKVSGKVAATFGGTLDFRALASLVTESTSDQAFNARSLPFAEVAVAVLSGGGGQHRSIARQLDRAVRQSLHHAAHVAHPGVSSLQFRPGDIVTATVSRQDEDGFYVTIGDGIGVLADEGQNTEEWPALAEEIEVEVLSSTTRDGFPFVSRHRARATRTWQRLRHVAEAGSTIAGTVVEVVKGGLIVDVGLRAFLPASLIGTRKVRDLIAFLGEEVEAKIIELDRDSDNVILSRRAWLKETEEANRRAFLSTLETGEMRTGVVSSIVNFGAFVDVGGLDGLVHISELSWAHLDHPSEAVTIGQEVTVQVLEVDLELQRVTLSLKRTQDDPLEQFARTHIPGQIVRGEVTKTVAFGAFVRVVAGVEGLVHISELAPRHIDSTDEIVQAGDAVFVQVIDLDLERRRLMLSLKRADETLGRDPASAEFDPTRYGMTAEYDDEGNYIYPEGFDAENDEWLEGFEAQRAAWEAEYAQAEALFEEHRAQVIRARLP
ncbi:SAV_2336 N-terminal domain-related protein [Streptomyces sp. NPDC058052]|uniref:SAV_2336 N-terminal domain-related protein n=1 Tax=Streptomyces sp. NPDC058052 TaxID=3346316 RepID=UPI0036F09EEF